MLLSLWRYRHFVHSSIRAEFLGRFARSKLGALWMILNPLAQATIFAVVLSEVLAAKLPHSDNKAAYAIYLIAGTAAWGLFAEILMQLWESSAEQRALIYRHDKPLRPQLLELMQSKMRMLSDSNFLDLARVAIAATIHSPERTQDMVARLGEREEGINTWISAAQADGRLKPGDPAFAAHQLQGLLKTFAFWPQVTLDQPPLAAALQQQVVDSAVDMFLANYAAGGPAR